MSIAQAESLKRELTDKYVVVQEGVAELRRFTGLTGQIRTVNMNGRALVQFDGPVDISWYDIDPAFLKVVAAPQPKAAAKHAEKAAAPKAEAAKPAPAAGKSPLELARAQGAGAKPAAPAGEGKKLSPLELARQQGAGGAAAAPAGEKKLSPLEQARQQGASKPAAAPPPVAEAPTPPPLAPAPAAAPAHAAKSARATPGSTAEIIALARQQGAFKG